MGTRLGLSLTLSDSLLTACPTKEHRMTAADAPAADPVPAVDDATPRIRRRRRRQRDQGRHRRPRHRAAHRRAVQASTRRSRRRPTRWPRRWLRWWPSSAGPAAWASPTRRRHRGHGAHAPANVDKGWIGVNAAEVISAALGGQPVRCSERRRRGRPRRGALRGGQGQHRCRGAAAPSAPASAPP